MSTQAIRRFVAVPALILVTAFGAACDDDATDVDDDVLVGDFTATEAVFTDNADANTTFDVIASDGRMDFDFRDDGTFRSELTIPDRDPVVSTGTFTVDGSDLMLTEAGTTRTASFQQTAAGNLILSDPGTRFDFGTGPTEATLDATFEQR